MPNRKRASDALAASPAQAISPGGLLADAFPGPSWARWRAILKAAHAEPLDEAELALFREVAERDPPAKRVRELWAIAGRRSGKDSIASAIATVAATGDYRAHLRPGERATVMCLACDREQARIVHRYIIGSFQSQPLLEKLMERETDDGLELSTGVEIIIATNSFRAVRGRTIVCVIFDEVAFWRSDESASPDIEVYNAVLPGLVTLPGAMLIGISSPYRRGGLLFDRWRHSYGKPDDDVLVIKGPSPLFNPTLPQSVIDAALARDPEAAAAEWLAEWRSDVGDFIDRELVESAIDVGVTVRPPMASGGHFAFADPSGGRGDGFACGIAHAEGNVAVLDALYERRPPFNPSDVVADVAALLRSYGCSTVVGDRYAAEWVVEAFAKEGIRYEASERDRSAIYLDALPLFTSGRARLLDSPRLAHQFASLERRTSRAGRDRVDHPPGGADDLANAAAGALVLAGSDARPSLIPVAALREHTPDADLGWVRGVYGTVWIDLHGTAASALFAYAEPRTVYLVDFSVEPWTGGMIEPLAEKLDALAEEARERNFHSRERGVGAWMFVPEQLAEMADAAMLRVFAPRLARIDARHRRIGSEAIDLKYMQDPVRLAFNGSAHWSAGRVKLGAAAALRSLEAPLMAALMLRPGDRVDDDPLRVAVLLGVALGFDAMPSHVAPAIPTARIQFG